MPRASYRPFTVYEEAIGFRNIKGLTKGIFGLLCGGLVLKMYMFVNYSGCTGYDDREMTPNQMELMASREQLIHNVTSRDELRRAMRGKLPPA